MITNASTQWLVYNMVNQTNSLIRLAPTPIASASSGALSALFHRIDAQPSGEIRISTVLQPYSALSPYTNAKATNRAPSLITVQIIGTLN